MLTDAQDRRYVMLRRVGVGGFGEVYAALRWTDSDYRKTVAVKLIHARAPADASARLRDEARLLSKKGTLHRAILKVEELVTLDGKLAVVTEFVEGEDLAACLRGDRGLPVRAQLEVLAEVSEALASVDAVHRDLKPSNIRIERRGGVKVLDFGLAVAQDVDREAETQGLVIGTPPYIAPERFASGDFLPASDIFALGCILYEGLTGERLMKLSTALLQELHGASETEWSVFVGSRLNAAPLTGQPTGLQQLLREMLQYDPADRPTASEVARRCEKLADTYPREEGLGAWCRAHEWPADAQVEPPEDARPSAAATDILHPNSNSTLPQDGRSSPRRRAGLVWVGVLSLLVASMAFLAVVVAAWPPPVHPDPPAPGPVLPVPSLPAPPPTHTEVAQTPTPVPVPTPTPDVQPPPAGPKAAAKGARPVPGRPAPIGDQGGGVGIAEVAERTVPPEAEPSIANVARPVPGRPAPIGDQGGAAPATTPVEQGKTVVSWPGDGFSSKDVLVFKSSSHGPFEIRPEGQATLPAGEKYNVYLKGYPSTVSTVTVGSDSIVIWCDPRFMKCRPR